MAKIHNASELFFCISRRHISNCGEIAVGKGVEEQIQIVVLEFLRFLVACGRFAHVTEVSISGNCAQFLCKSGKLADIHALIGGINIEFFNEVAFENAENVEFIEILGSCDELLACFPGHCLAGELVDEIACFASVGISCGNLLGKSVADVTFGYTASFM